MTRIFCHICCHRIFCYYVYLHVAVLYMCMYDAVDVLVVVH
jgi:hypothetical protein